MAAREKEICRIRNGMVEAAGDKYHDGQNRKENAAYEIILCRRLFVSVNGGEHQYSAEKSKNKDTQRIVRKFTVNNRRRLERQLASETGECESGAAECRTYNVSDKRKQYLQYI